MNIYLAVDLGASSGRVMAGICQDPKDGSSFELREIHRFKNHLQRQGDRLVWDHERLWNEIKTGMKKASELEGDIQSVGVDSWGVDYVLIDGEGNAILPNYAYRDETFTIQDLEINLYERTGILPQSINTIYQLMLRDPEDLAKADQLLFTADYFHYLLSDVYSTERSLASTSALMDGRSGDWAWDVIDAAKLPRNIFGEIQPAGTVIGDLREDLVEELGYSCKVILPCSHDTASAYFAIPRGDEPTAILSSGTWSLLGCERKDPITTEEAYAAGFTNEWGYGELTLMLQNLSGMWIIQEIRRQEAPDAHWDDLEALAKTEDAFPSRIDPSEERFLAPQSMVKEIKQACEDTGQKVPETLAQVLSVFYHSLAETYAEKIHAMEALTGETYETLHIVGGGSKDQYMNDLTRKATGIEVKTGPVEGSALGNLLIQMIGNGDLASVDEARSFLAQWIEAHPA